MPEPNPLLVAKADLRREMRQLRSEVQQQNRQAALALRDIFLAAIELPQQVTVSGYAARDSEIDPYPLMEALHQRGHPLCLPVTGKIGEPLTFRAYQPADVLEPAGNWMIPEPAILAPVVEPDIVLAPLLAFDLRGNRLGQGAGYYDKTLTELRKHKKILAIGIAFNCQRVDRVPTGPNDALLDKAVTETQAYSLLKAI